jgi:hypothetical protein
MFEHITDYYDYILKSRIGGNHEEAWIHFNFLSPSQKQDFFKYVGDDNDETQEFINLKQYFNYADNV